MSLTVDPGDYLIEVATFSGAGTGAFELAVDVLSAGVDEDAEGPVAIEGAVDGGLFPTGDTDEYRFTGLADEVFDISLVSEVFDTVVELDLDGEIVGFDDDGGNGFNSLLSGFVLPADGDYVVRVRSFADAGAGAYRLSVMAATTAFTYQGLVTPGVYEQTLPAGGIHLYALEVAGSSELSAQLVSDEFDAFLVLYAGGQLADRTAANRIALDDDGGDDLNSHLIQFLTPGTYLVEARSYHADASGAYVLDLRLEARATDDDVAPAIAVGDSVVGELFPAGDRDGYAFTGNEGDVVDIGIDSEQFDPVLSVLFEGTVIAFDDDGGDGFNSLLTGFVLPVTGEYTVLVQPFGDLSTGAYGLFLRDVTPPVQLADPLVVGAVGGDIVEAGQIDVYPLELTSASLVELDLVSAEFDAFLSVFAGAGSGARRGDNLVADDDDGGVGFNSRLVLVLEPGDYLVEARPLFSHETGAYQLSLSLTSLADDEDAAGPVAVSLGDVIAARLTPAGDEDRFRFAGSAGAIVDLSASSDSIDTFLELRLDDEALVGDDDSGGDLDALIAGFVLPADGTYEVRVGDAGGRGSGPYVLELTDRTPNVVTFDPLVAGLGAGSLSAAGEIHLYPLTVSLRSTIELELVSSAFDPVLDLHRGDGAVDVIDDNLVASDDSSGGAQNAALAVDLRPGAYLVGVRDATATGTGAYGLQLKTTPLPPDRSTLSVLSGVLNDTQINPLDPVLRLDTDAKITGSLRLEIDNTHSSDVVFPVGATPTWGARSDSWWEVVDWAGVGRSEVDVAVDLTAPSVAGTYHLLLAGADEPSVAEIMSGTHWESDADPRWQDDDDVAAWDDEQIGQAIDDGWTAVRWFSDYDADVAAAAVRVEVREPATFPRGPIAIDFDTTTGNQSRQRRVTAGAGERIRVELHAEDMQEVNGWGVLLRFDPDQLQFVEGSFAAGDFIAGLIALVSESDGHLELGGTVLGSSTTSVRDGFLGALSFDVTEGFSFSTDLVIEQVTLRVPDRGRVKQDVRSRAVLSAPAAGLPAGPMALDLDTASGDQGLRRQEGVEPLQRIDVGISVADAPESDGWSARIEFDPEQVAYVAGSFRPADFISGLIPLVSQKVGRVDVGGAVLGGAASGAGDGDLGALAFETAETFADSAVIAITRISFNTVASGEAIEVVRNRILLTTATPSEPEPVAGDFNDDGVVDFGDFFRFADHFGLTSSDPAWDPLYDMEPSGEVDFSDFFRFADAFGGQTSGARAKLLALAVEHIGLPLTAVLDQNAPNPFNATTAIPYHLLQPGRVAVEIYDMAGQRVRLLREGLRQAGSYVARWDGRDRDGAHVSSGVYVYRLRLPGQVDPRVSGLLQPRKMLLLR